MNKVLMPLGVVCALMSDAVLAQEESSNFYIGAGYGLVAIPDGDEISFSDANNGFIQLGYKLTENFSIEGQYSKSTKDADAKLVVENIDVSEAWWAELEQYDPGWSGGVAQSIFPYATIDVTTNIKASIETAAIYGVYRSSGDLYFKLKAGYLREDSTLTISPSAFEFYSPVAENVTPNEPVMFSSKKGDDNFDAYVGDFSGDVSESESDFSAGVGVGYKFNDRFFSELEYTALNDDLDMYSLSINFAF
jgi:hypothetical protein